VSVDEHFILFKGRFKHITNILSKEADRGFKIYCLCSENYLYAFMYASKTTKIVGLHQIQDFTPSASMIVQIVKSLPQPYEYVVYLVAWQDNNTVCFIHDNGSLAWGSSKNRSQRSSIQAPYS